MKRKMTRVGLICFLLLGAMACGREEKPAGVLSHEQYVAWLIDVYEAEARLTGYAIPQDSAMKLFKPYEAGLLQKHGVADSTVLKTYRYYLDHPQEMEQIYTAVIDSLSLKEQKAAGRTP